MPSSKQHQMLKVVRENNYGCLEQKVVLRKGSLADFHFCPPIPVPSAFAPGVSAFVWPSKTHLTPPPLGNSKKSWFLETRSLEQTEQKARHRKVIVQSKEVNNMLSCPKDPEQNIEHGPN